MKQTNHRFRTGCLILVLSACMLTTPAAKASGWPVVDAIGNAMLGSVYGELTSLVSSAAAELAQLTQMYTTLQDELKVVTDTYNTLHSLYTEIRGITQHGLMLPNPVAIMHDYLPRGQLPDPSVLINNGGGLSKIASLGRQSQQAYEKVTANKLFSGVFLPSEKQQYEKESQYIYGYMGVARSAYEKIYERRTKIESLATAIRTADTPKAIQDLNTRIAAENALLLNDIAQLQVVKMMADLERDNLIHNQSGAEKELKSVKTIK